MTHGESGGGGTGVKGKEQESSESARLRGKRATLVPSVALYESRQVRAHPVRRHLRSPGIREHAVKFYVSGCKEWFSVNESANQGQDWGCHLASFSPFDGTP